jgi:class 3 adenylate cyclase/tetratricopeptide (TPR) repeat protein
MTDRVQLEQTIAHLETQRTVLGNAAVDVAIAGVKDRLQSIVKSHYSGERKLVTIMFADISGFTALAEKMDPEIVRDTMNRCFDHLVPCVKRYDGTIDKFIGDEIMALFGAPQAHENDPERALRSAIEMQSALARFNAEHNMQLGIHFGINTGLVLAGAIGSSGQQAYSVIGDAVNLASRLEDISERGQILVGPDTYRLTAALFNFEALPPTSIKGKSEFVTIYRLTGVKAGASSTRGLARKGLTSQVVGRDKELEALNDCMEKLRRRQGGVVGVIGEVGLGKSRLILEFHRTAQDFQWVEGKTLSFGNAISYWPFREILRGYANIAENDGEQQVWEKLESKILALFPDSAQDILPYLAIVLAIDVQGSYQDRVRYLEGDALRKRVFIAMRRFIERLTYTAPLILVFDDLHWMDASSAELLKYILTLVREVPLLLVGISRPNQDTPGADLREICASEYADVYTELRLRPLSPVESSQLVNNLLTIDNLPARVQETMMQKAEGNPFFIEEILRSMMDMGLIVRDPASGRWHAMAQIETVHIPDTIQGIIMARIDCLDEAVKQALCLAAVIGRSFLYRILREVDQTDGDLDANLAHLQQLELIREKEVRPELEYIFSHALAQEATYESILLNKRRELHGRVAEAIETLFADRLEEFYSLLAYHYAKAENWVKAQAFLFKSGDQAGHMAADTEALAHYQQAIEAYTRAFGDHWDPLQKTQLERKLGAAFFRRGDHQQALIYLKQALGNLGVTLPISTWEVRVGIVREVSRQVAHRLLPYWLVKPINQSFSLALEEEIHVYEEISWIDLLSNSERLLYMVLKLLNLSESHGYLRGIAGGSAGTGTICDLLNIYPVAGHYHYRALGLTGVLKDPSIFGQVYISLAGHTFFQGQWDQTIQFSQQGAEKFLEIGDLHKWCLSINWTILAQIYRGAFDDALVMCQKVVGLANECADLQMLCWGLAGEGLVQHRLGLLDEAIPNLQRAAELAKMLPDMAFAISATADVGRCYLRQGRLDLAIESLETSQRLFVPNMGSDSYASLRNGFAEIYLHAAEHSRPGEQATWLKKAKSACQEALKLGKEFPPGQPEALRLQGTYEWLRGHAAAAQQRWQSSLALAQQMGQRYDEGKAHYEIGLRLGKLDHLHSAELIFSEIGAAIDLKKTRDALAAIE